LVKTIHQNKYRALLPDAIQFQADQRKFDSCENSPIYVITSL